MIQTQAVQLLSTLNLCTRPPCRGTSNVREDASEDVGWASLFIEYLLYDNGFHIPYIVFNIHKNTRTQKVDYGPRSHLTV